MRRYYVEGVNVEVEDANETTEGNIFACNLLSTNHWNRRRKPKQDYFSQRSCIPTRDARCNSPLSLMQTSAFCRCEVNVRSYMTAYSARAPSGWVVRSAGQLGEWHSLASIRSVRRGQEGDVAFYRFFEAMLFSNGNLAFLPQNIYYNVKINQEQNNFVKKPLFLTMKLSTCRRQSSDGNEKV